MRLQLILLSAVFALAACDPRKDGAPIAAPASPAAASVTEANAPGGAANPAQRVAAGPPAAIPAEEDSALQTSASVVRVDPLERQGPLTVKLFGVTGGDPAMNGLQTWLAVFRSPAEGWTVFRIGDILDYRILSEAPGRVDLEITESRLDDATGEIEQGTRRLIVGWPVSTDGAAPLSITVTPAR